MTSVLIADDQELLRIGLRKILDAEPDTTVVGEAADGEDAVAAARRLRPDVVLMDIRMPGVDGIADYVYEAMKAGASGFLLKTAPPRQLADAVRTIAAGDALLAPAITRRLVEQFVRPPPPGTRVSPGLEGLAERELDVLRLLARAQSNAEIVAELVEPGSGLSGAGR